MGPECGRAAKRRKWADTVGAPRLVRVTSSLCIAIQNQGDAMPHLFISHSIRDGGAAAQLGRAK